MAQQLLLPAVPAETLGTDNGGHGGQDLGRLWCPIIMASKDDTILGCHINAVVI